MISPFRKTALACALMLATTGALAQSGALDTEPGTDNLGVDFYQQNDFYTSGFNRPESTTGFFERQMVWELDNQYPLASVLMSSVGRGMTLADSAYFMAKARPEQAEEIHDLAVDILPVLPGWACSASGAMANRYDQPLTAEDVGPTPTLNQLAALYFDQGKRFQGYPEWQQNQGHASVSIDELILFKEKDLEDTGVDSWWYRPDERVETDVLAVSLYPGERRVVIDARLEELQQLKAGGAGNVPVMLLYTEQTQIPMSDFNRDPEGCDEDDNSNACSTPARDSGNAYIDYDDQEISASEVISRYASTGERASPTRDWHQGDHHLRVQVEELQSLFDIPDKADIPGEDWQRWERQLEAGVEKPLLISLYSGAGGDSWLDEKGLVAVAADKQMERLPVVFFYHSSQRQPCGLPATCVSDIEQAIVKGSRRIDLPFGSGAAPTPPAGRNPSVLPPPGANPSPPPQPSPS